MTEQGGSYQNQSNKDNNKNGSKGKNVVHEGLTKAQKRKKKKGSKGKNADSVKVKKEEECYDPSLPAGINLPMEWTY